MLCARPGCWPETSSKFRSLIACHCRREAQADLVSAYIRDTLLLVRGKSGATTRPHCTLIKKRGGIKYLFFFLLSFCARVFFTLVWRSRPTHLTKSFMLIWLNIQHVHTCGEGLLYDHIQIHTVFVTLTNVFEKRDEKTQVEELVGETQSGISGWHLCKGKVSA